MYDHLLIDSIILLCVGLMLRFQNQRINICFEKKLDKEMFEMNREDVKKDLKKGNDKFTSISESLEKHGELLARIDERTKILPVWAKQNGLDTQGQ